MKEDKNELLIRNFIEIKQNIGTFLICSIKPSDLLEVSVPNPREYDEGLDKYVGIQRQIDKNKLTELKKYIKTQDACFPNSIIANIDTSFIKEYSDKKLILKKRDELDPNKRALFIIDGQHRVQSFKGEQSEDFDLIVAIFLGLSIEDQAYLFSTINNKQKKLNSSLVQDLNDLFEIKTPEKIVHLLTNIFNEDDEMSPWKEKIKILGKNIEKNGEKIQGIMSQYSFAKEIIKLICGSSNDYFTIRDILKENKNDRIYLKEWEKYDIYRTKYIFWEYYVESREDEIYEFLYIYFKAVSLVFSEEWGNNNYILSKTTGYIALMRLYVDIFSEENKDDLKDIKKIELIFEKIKKSGKLMNLTSDKYESGVKGQNKLYENLKDGYLN